MPKSKEKGKVKRQKKPQKKKRTIVYSLLGIPFTEFESDVDLHEY